MPKVFMHVLKIPWSGSPSGIVTTVKVGGNVASAAVTAHTLCALTVGAVCSCVAVGAIGEDEPPPPHPVISSTATTQIQTSLILSIGRVLKNPSAERLPIERMF